MHHISIKTANIHRSIEFYQHLGFAIEERFTTGYTLACWLLGELGRIELIQVPEPKIAADPFNDEQYVGFYHISFDLTDKTESLSTWLKQLQHKTNIKILLPPQQQMIGNSVYEVAFIADPDGSPLELLAYLGQGI